MKNLRVLATVMIVALAALAIWVAGIKPRAGGTAAGNPDTPGSAYDYDARDVLVRQMGPDGALQYELEAKQVTQQPGNGQISAQDLVMHHDPAGGAPDGANRWTLTASHANLPESGTAITLQGQVHAQGRPPNSRAQISVDTDLLTYNLETQDVSSDKPVDFSWGDSRFHCGNLRMNIKLGTLSVESECNATLAP
ncbi:MAG: LPS export ABC transporter periplasmic protein LptC [Steroidobacteraceae bacterium]